MPPEYLVVIVSCGVGALILGVFLGGLIIVVMATANHDADTARWKKERLELLETSALWQWLTQEGDEMLTQLQDVSERDARHIRAWQKLVRDTTLKPSTLQVPPGEIPHD